jgi:hypothetical protein
MTITLTRRVASATSDALILSAYDVDESLIDAASIGSCRYRVDDKVSRRQLRDWTTLVVTRNPFHLPLTPADTVVLNRRRAVEEHVVSVEMQFAGAEGSGQVFAEQIVVHIENQLFRP